MAKYIPTSKHKGILPAILGYRQAEENPALKMFQQLWGKELQGHPRFYSLLVELAALHSSKNQDYGGTKQHPFAVYKRSAKLGIEPWLAALCRLSEKWARLETFAQKRAYLVEDETFKDTLLDMAVISLIVLILYEEENNANEKASPTQARTGNKPENRGCTDKMSNTLNDAFQTGYKEKDTGQADKAVSEVPKPERPRDDGSSPRLGQSAS